VAFTYSGDPSSTDKDEVRFHLQDTDAGFPLLLDEEIEWLIDEWKPKYDSLLYVASVGAATISRRFAGMVSVSADGVNVQTGDLAERYRALAVELREQHTASMVGGEVDISNIMIGSGPEPGVKPLRFGVGLHDNPEAGLQDYGTWSYDPFRAAESVPF
jgi:hypothetical protein